MGDLEAFERILDRVVNNQCIPYEWVFTETIIDNLKFQIVVGCLYSIIWFLGTICNTLVLLALLNESRKTRPWVSNRRISSISSCGSAAATSAFFSTRCVFVGSLACADLLTSLTSLPLTSISIFTREWIFPAFLCSTIGVLQGFSQFQSSFTFSSIAIDRYLLIFYPNRSLMTKRKAVIGLTVTAAVSLLLSSPMGAFVSLWDTPEFETDLYLCGRYCIEKWPKDNLFWDPRVYGSLVLIIKFGVPICITSWCYGQVAGRLRRLSQRRRSGFCTSNVDLRRQSFSSGLLSATSKNSGGNTNGKRQRANRMMLAMVVAFTVSWSPHNILNLIRDFGLSEQLHGPDLFPALYAVAHLIAMTTCIWNPIIYAWFNPSIREVLKVFVYWKFRERS